MSDLWIENAVLFVVVALILVGAFGSGGSGAD